MVLQAGCHCVILKKDIKDAFHYISVALNGQSLLDPLWDEKIDQEPCFSFGLAISPFIFNLFGKTI